MSYKSDRTFYILLVRIFVVIAVIGMAALLYTGVQGDLSQLAFTLIAFVIGVAALVMTTLQSLSIARQVRITERAAHMVHEASQRIETLVGEDRKLEREIRQDIEFDHAIIAVLEEYGVGENEHDRREVAVRLKEAVSIETNAKQ